MSHFNEWLQKRDPDLFESMLGNMWKHVQMNPDTGAMPEDEQHEELLNNELKSSIIQLPFEQGYELFTQAMHNLKPGYQWKPGELKIAYKRLLKKTSREHMGYKHQLDALHKQQADRLAGKVYP